MIFFFVNLPRTSFGEEYTFAPTFFSSEGYLDIGAISSSSESLQGGQRSDSTDRLLTESLRFSANGFVYHPRFLLFNATLSEGLNQESGTGGDRNGTATNYELRTLLLPEHPYNLELFTLHKQTFFPGTAGGAAGTRGTVDAQGAMFTYRERPFSFRASYYGDTIDNSIAVTDSKSYRASGEYKGNIVTNTASYSHQETRAPQRGLVTTQNSYVFDNSIHYEQDILDSRVNAQTHDQTNPLYPEFRLDTVTWTEQLSALLPWHFSANAYSSYQNEVARTAETSSTPETEASSRTENETFTLSHQLYESLTSHYSLIKYSITSQTGDLTGQSQALGTVYTKIIPVGRLTTGVQFGKAESDRTGTPVILDEPHDGALTAIFFLAQQNVVLSTIQIQVIDPGTLALITLPQTDYSVTMLGNQVQITIFSVSPLTPQPPGFAYHFFASYLLSQVAESNVTAKSAAYSFKLDLLDNLVSPYFNHTISEQEVASGSLAGVPDRITTETVGVTAVVGYYSGLVEYLHYDSRLNPYDQRKTRAAYRVPLSEDTNIAVSLTFVLTNHLNSPSGQGGFRETNAGSNVSADMKFPHEHLSLMMTGSYYRTRSIFDSDTYSINTSLTWQEGLLSVSGGAQLNRVETMLAATRTLQNGQYYYLAVSRRLF